MFLCLNNVTKQYTTKASTTYLLHQCNFVFDRQRSYAILGASGSGKTTLLRMLAGIIPCDVGTIFLDNHQVKKTISRSDISFMPQETALFAELTVLDNVILAAKTNGYTGLGEKETYVHFLSEFGLEGCEQLFPQQLSGGMQQRVSLIQGLVRKPLFLLADEPTAHLDVHNKRMVIKKMIAYTKKNHIGLLLATHDHTIIQQVDYALYLQKGSLCIAAPKNKTSTHE